MAIPAPKPSDNYYDHALAAQGKAIFEGPAKCATCHVPPLFSEPGWPMHTGAEIGIDDFQANRSPDRRYRTTPLQGLFVREKGGFYHDGRFATLRARNRSLRSASADSIKRSRQDCARRIFEIAVMLRRRNGIAWSLAGNRCVPSSC